MIELADISRTYQRPGQPAVQALRPLSLRIERGDFVTIRGRSGSGKSSLLNILGCLDTPTTGSYRLDGRDVSRCSDRERSHLRRDHIGFVFQSFHLLPRTTALENVELPLQYVGGRSDRRRAAALLERVGLGERARHFASELSGGEQQRVAIARALVLDPALLLADEPTGNLDSAAGTVVMRLLSELHGEGRTIVLVTHDEAVAAHARREVLLEDGAVVADRSRA
jgi:putative ABC transport system ATP-binding protein